MSENCRIVVPILLSYVDSDYLVIVAHKLKWRSTLAFAGHDLFLTIPEYCCVQRGCMSCSLDFFLDLLFVHNVMNLSFIFIHETKTIFHLYQISIIYLNWVTSDSHSPFAWNVLTIHIHCSRLRNFDLR